MIKKEKKFQPSALAMIAVQASLIIFAALRVPLSIKTPGKALLRSSKNQFRINQYI